MKPIDRQFVLAAQAAQHVTGVLACVSLAQFGLESAWGAKVTGRFNYFGIKAKPGQAMAICETHEEVSGKLVPCLQHFRAFASPAEAFMAHAELLATAPVYATAMLHRNDPVTFVRAMAVHYATDPGYADKLLDIIESDGLRGYDLQAVEVAA